MITSVLVAKLGMHTKSTRIFETGQPSQASGTNKANGASQYRFIRFSVRCILDAPPKPRRFDSRFQKATIGFYRARNKSNRPDHYSVIDHALHVYAKTRRSANRLPVRCMTNYREEHKLLMG